MIPLLIVNGLHIFDVFPSSTGDSSTHRGRTTAFNVLPSSTDDSSTNCGQTADLLLYCPAGAPNFLRSIDTSAIFLVELTPEMTWNLFASPRTRCGEIPFGGVRQESSSVKKVH
ncbi:integrase_H2C2 domain-containing protein [Trichonephila clavipes]|nr:integrase_H2C2 domain-containing protein [Trichonephila clavipes]